MPQTHGTLDEMGYFRGDSNLVTHFCDGIHVFITILESLREEVLYR